MNTLPKRIRVDLIASGYEWVCPKCKQHNNEVVIPKGGLIDGEVYCRRCNTHYAILDVQHAIN